jgi:hypothetical protein
MRLCYDYLVSLYYVILCILMPRRLNMQYQSGVELNSTAYVINLVSLRRMRPPTTLCAVTQKL